MKASVRRLEIAVATFLLLLAALAAWQAVTMPAGTPSLPGPGMLPLALGVVLALTSIGLVLLRPKPESPAEQPVLIGHWNIAAVVAALLGAGILFERVGFLVTSVLFLYALFLVASPLSWWRALLIAIGAGFAAKLLFQDALGVALPSFPFGPA